jgi:hypothetical protein
MTPASERARPERHPLSCHLKHASAALLPRCRCRHRCALHRSEPGARRQEPAACARELAPSAAMPDATCNRLHPDKRLGQGQGDKAPNAWAKGKATRPLCCLSTASQERLAAPSRCRRAHFSLPARMHAPRFTVAACRVRRLGAELSHRACVGSCVGATW